MFETSKNYSNTGFAAACSCSEKHVTLILDRRGSNQPKTNISKLIWGMEFPTTPNPRTSKTKHTKPFFDHGRVITCPSRPERKIRRASGQGVSDHPLCDLDIHSFGKCTMETNSSSSFEHTSPSNIVGDLCLNCCFLIEKCANGGAVRGARERAIQCFSHIGGHLFLHVFLASFLKSRD